MLVLFLENRMQKTPSCRKDFLIHMMMAITHRIAHCGIKWLLLEIECQVHAVLSSDIDIQGVRLYRQGCTRGSLCEFEVHNTHCREGTSYSLLQSQCRAASALALQKLNHAFQATSAAHAKTTRPSLTVMKMLTICKGSIQRLQLDSFSKQVGS